MDKFGDRGPVTPGTQDDWNDTVPCCNAPDATPVGGVESVLKERGKRYGSFTGQASLSQSFKQLIALSRDRLKYDQQEALEMIVHKIARILNGDPNYADSWVDIAGYATLVANRLEGKTSE